MTERATVTAAMGYEVNCSACRNLEGEGIEGMVTAFTGNHRMLSDDPKNLIHAMLMGTRAPHTEARRTAAGMPPLAWKMNDQEIADILTFVLNSWSNGAQAITASKVAELRTTLNARDMLRVPETKSQNW